jgi:predicted acetyltransferase
MADSYPIRPISPDEFDAYHAVDEQAFLGGPPNERQRAAIMRHLEFDRTLSAFDGGIPVGNTASWGFDLCLPGAMGPAAGVTLVAVTPTHRRRGIMSSLMRRQLADLRERGEAIAILWASEAELYGRFGYGPATWQESFCFRRGDGTLRPDTAQLVAAAVSADGGGAGGLRLRIVEPETARAELGKVYQAVLPGRPGMYARDDPAWWDRLLRTHDTITSETETVRCVLAEDDSGPRGYAVYTARLLWEGGTGLSNGSLNVSELVAADPPATALLWGDLLSRDLISEYTAAQRPVDDPLIHLLADSRRARRRVSDALWVRLTDLPKALGLRRYAAPVNVVIEVTDALLPQNSGRWRLVAEGGSDGAGTCSPAGDGDAADLTVSVAALGAAYLGGTRLAPLAAAGQVREHRPGAVGALSAALSWDPAPWCPQIF